MTLVLSALIKFLHEQMGFDVIAFERGLYDCYYANANATPSLGASALSRRFICHCNSQS